MGNKKCYLKNAKTGKFEGSKKGCSKKEATIKSNGSNTRKNNNFFEQFEAGTKDMVRNYKDMKDAKTIGSDKYFHCKANCEASRRGTGGKAASYVISGGREVYGHYKGEPITDTFDDLVANEVGRRGDSNKKCKEVCSSLRPKGLKSKY
ncbi:Serum amyloid A protein [Candidatus Magnetoovum chiemensis]|nr:Serum amyloid A protein [Candidatus Magnetoovum chiemensis]